MLLACLLPSAALAAYPGANGRIAYVGWAPNANYGDIFTAFPDGSGTQQLTDTEGESELDPSWSADGRRIAYVDGAPGSLGYQVFTMSASGANQTQVTDDIGSHRTPSFSPSGRRIVYEKRGKIFTIRTNGSDRRRIVPSYATSPEYSPDGKHIVFLRCDTTASIHSCEGDLYLMRGYGRYRHPIRRAGVGYSPAFSPAGNRIALTRSRNEICSDIHTITPWGTRRRMVTHNCDTSGAFAAQASWQALPRG